MLMDASALATQLCHLDSKAYAFADLTWESPSSGNGFLEGHSFIPVIILEVPKKTVAENSWRWWSRAPFSYVFPLYLPLFTNCCQIVTKINFDIFLLL